MFISDGHCREDGYHLVIDFGSVLPLLVSGLLLRADVKALTELRIDFLYLIITIFRKLLFCFNY